MEPWRSATLARQQTDNERFLREVLRPMEASYARLENRTDIRADLQREQLRPKLAAALAERDDRQLVHEALQELEEIVNHLRPLYVALDTPPIQTGP